MSDDDDWELDDWEEEAFDEDVWDSTQLDLEPDDWGDGEHDEGGEPLGEDVSGGGGFGGGGFGGAGKGGGGMSWSAWEVGTVFALGGWLVDRQAEQVGAQVREALASAGRVEASGAGPPRSAPHPPPPSGYPYPAAGGTLEVGDPLDQGALFAALTAASVDARDWLVQAEGRSDAGGLLLLVVSVVPSSAGPRLWVVAEEHPGGFSATRLVPVFQPERTSGLGIFATDHPVEAADAAAWACAREGVQLDALTVMQSR